MKERLFLFMAQIGKFRGYPVIRIMRHEWEVIERRFDNKIYVVDDDVFFHDQRIAIINARGELMNFNEGMFTVLEKQYAERSSQAPKVKEKREEKVEEPISEPAAANIVDSFMGNWRKNIDDKIAEMKKKTEEMGIKLSELG